MENDRELMQKIHLGFDNMTVEDLVAISRNGAGVQLTKASEKRIINTRKLIEKLVQEEKVIYGVTTGFGALSDVSIPKKD